MAVKRRSRSLTNAANAIGREPLVNKAELIEALSGRLGDRKSATAALDAVLSEIQNAVTKGDKVSITGFGVFEKRVRAARTARNAGTTAKTIATDSDDSAVLDDTSGVESVPPARPRASASRPATT
jgi:DNA-binding protein HU-beta